MTSAFKVGDKVVNSVFGAGEIVYGPYDGASYFMKAEDGEHHTVSASYLTPAAKFKVGDKARGTMSGHTYSIEGGPFFGPQEWYAAKHELTGHVTQVNASNLLVVEPEAPADEDVKVGDVVRVLRDGAFSADVEAGDLLRVTRLVNYDGRIRVKAAPGARMDEWTLRPQDFAKVPADKVTEHGGKLYDLSVRYRDKDGDYWTFKDVNGTVRGICSGINVDRTADIASYSDTFQSAIRSYGPLTRV